MVFPICPLVVSNKAKGAGNRGLWKKHENVKKIKLEENNMKFGTLNWHKVGQIRSYRAVDKWIRCGILRSFIWEGSQVARKPSWWEKSGKTVWNNSFFKFLTFFCHQVGRIKVLWALVKCIRRRILRSFICDGSRGLILSNNSDLFQKTFNFWDLLGVKNGEKSEMFDEMGQNSSKFGNFDTNRCAPGVGPQKCWFLQIFPNFLGVTIHSSFFGSFLAPRIPRLGPY